MPCAHGEHCGRRPAVGLRQGVRPLLGRWACLLLALTVALAGAGCSPPSQTTGAPALPVAGPSPVEPELPVVGVLLPQSGGQAAAGRAAERAVRLAAEGRSGLRLAVADTAGEPEAAVRAADRLIEENRAAVLLAVADADSAFALAALAERARVPLLVVGTGDPLLTAQRQYTFRLGPADAVAARAAAAALRRAGRLTLVEDAADPRSHGMAEAFALATGRRGVARAVVYGPQGPALAEALAVTARARPGAVFLATPAEVAVELLQRWPAADLGAAVPAFVLDPVLPPASGERLAQALAALAQPAWTAVAYHEGAGDLAARFARAYRAAGGGEPDAVAALAYDAMGLVAEAVAAAIPSAREREAVREALRRLPPRPGATGPVGFAGSAEGSRTALAVRVRADGSRLLFESPVGQAGEASP